MGTRADLLQETLRVAQQGTNRHTGAQLAGDPKEDERSSTEQAHVSKTAVGRPREEVRTQIGRHRCSEARRWRVARENERLELGCFLGELFECPGESGCVAYQGNTEPPLHLDLVIHVAAEPADVLVHQIEPQDVAAGARRREHVQRNDLRLSGRQIRRQRRMEPVRGYCAVAFEPTVGEPHLGLAPGAAWPGRPAEVLDSDVVGALLAFEQRLGLVEEVDLGSMIRIRELASGPEPVDLRFVHACHHSRRRPAHVGAGKDTANELCVRRRKRRSAKLRPALGKVEDVVHGPAAHPLPGPQGLVPPRFRLALFERVQEQVRVVEGKSKESVRPESLDRPVRLRRERQEKGVVAYQAKLIVGAPWMLGEHRSIVRPQPTAQQPVVGDVGRTHELRQRREQLGSRNLIVVDVEDPVAVTTRVEPPQRPVDRLAVRIAHHLVGNCGNGALCLGVGAVVERDDELSCDRTQEVKQRGDAPSRPRRHETDGERRAGDRFRGARSLCGYVRQESDRSASDERPASGPALPVPREDETKPS